MVFAQIGDAAGVGAVFEDADAIDVEAANDRPARGARRKGRAGNAGLGKQEIAQLGGALAANFVVRHHGDRCELIGDDRQHTLLGGSCDRRGLRFCRAFAVLAWRGAGDARRRSGRCRFSAYDRAWRRHGDFRQLCRGRRRRRVLGHCVMACRAQQ